MHPPSATTHRPQGGIAWPQVRPRLLLRPECAEDHGGDGQLHAVHRVHKNAFALVTRQLEMPLGAPKAFSTSYDGFGLRVVQGYDQKTKTDTVSIDMLCGVKTLSPELAAVITDKR